MSGPAARTEGASRGDRRERTAGRIRDAARQAFGELGWDATRGSRRPAA